MALGCLALRKAVISSAVSKERYVLAFVGFKTFTDLPVGFEKTLYRLKDQLVALHVSKRGKPASFLNSGQPEADFDGFFDAV